MRLAYFSGSPFARMCRVLVSEWSLPVQTIELAFPSTDELRALNPLGQVPVLLRDDGTSLFPTVLIMEELWRMAGSPETAYRNGDRQTLLTVLLATDAYAAACYQKWSGLRPVARNALGFDLGQRQRDRVVAVLDWVERGGVRPGVTLPGVALACLCLWADAREGLDWRRRPRLAAVIDGLAARDSFARTQPRKWSYE
jgi:glutathione S-transferase